MRNSSSLIIFYAPVDQAVVFKDCPHFMKHELFVNEWSDSYRGRGQILTIAAANDAVVIGTTRNYILRYNYSMDNLGENLRFILSFCIMYTNAELVIGHNGLELQMATLLKHKNMLSQSLK